MFSTNVALPDFVVGEPTVISVLPVSDTVGAFAGSSTSPITNVPSEIAKPRTALVGPSPFLKTDEDNPSLFGSLLSCFVLTDIVPVPFRWSVPLPSLRNALVPVRVMASDTVTLASLSNTVGRPAPAPKWNPGIVTSGPV